ncbi:MAG: SGNH/GDSL hydrolase family protein [Candidatus Saelkia tenebricola]|nr:SGNH/GDSL hydrolase family protein [Candidatus Saelkia tenebricola]
MKKIFLILLGLVISLVLIELTLRILGFGYKIRYKLPEETTSDYSIFCIGESSTWGIGTDNPTRDNYPKQLEAMLGEQFPDKKIRCYFDVTIGQNTSEILFKLPGYIKKYHPNIIILMVGANNFWNLDRGNILVFNKNETVSQTALKTLFFLNKLRIWKLARFIRLSPNLYKEKWDYSDKNRVKSFWDGKSYQGKLDRIAYTIAEHDISEMIKICRENQISVILCSYPIKDELLHEVHMKVAQKHNISLLDNHTIFKNIPDACSYLSKDMWHPNKKGYALLAKNIYLYLIKNELIK